MSPFWPTKPKVLLLSIGLVFFASIYVVRIHEDMADFLVNYRAGERLRAGEDLYRTADGHFMFKYLPFSALLYVPLSFLPVEVAKAVWYTLLVCCAVSLFYLSNRIVAPQGAADRAWVVFPPLILAKFFLREMKLGQINIIVTLVLLGMVWFLISAHEGEPRHARRAGVLWGLGTALKPYGLIFLPYFVVKGRWAALTAGAGSLLLALLLPSLFYGFAGNLRLLQEWAATLSRSTPALFLSNDNISLVAFFMKWTRAQELSLLLAGVTIGIVAVLLLLVIRAGSGIREPATLECAVLLTLIPLVSPLGWDYTLLMSVLAVTILVRYYAYYSRLWRFVLVLNFCAIALSIYDLIGPTYYGIFMASSILTINFLIVICLLVQLRFKKLA